MDSLVHGLKGYRHRRNYTGCTIFCDSNREIARSENRVTTTLSRITCIQCLSAYQKIYLDKVEYINKRIGEVIDEN